MTDSTHNEALEQRCVLAAEEEMSESSEDEVFQDEDINDMRRAMAGKRPLSGSQFVDDVVPDDWIVDDDFVKPLKRQNAKTDWAELPSDEEQPDLDEFFNEFGTDRKTRISICRAYASYLSSLLPKNKK